MSQNAAFQMAQLTIGKVKVPSVLFQRLILNNNDNLVARYATKAASDQEGNRNTKWYQLSGVGKATVVSMKTDTGHVLSSDVPKNMGGTNLHPQPVEHLLAALVGCEQVTATYVGRSMNRRLLIDRIEFDISANRDARGALQQPIDDIPPIPARVQQVSGIVKVFVKDGRVLSEEELKLLKHQTEARCPVANMMVASGCDMLVEWKDGNASD